MLSRREIARKMLYRNQEREKETDEALGRSRSSSKPEKIKGITMIKAVITDLGAVFDLQPQCGSGRGRGRDRGQGQGCA